MRSIMISPRLCFTESLDIVFFVDGMCSNDYAILGDEEVEQKFGVKPRALPDLFGLVGDVADNIPGER